VLLFCCSAVLPFCRSSFALSRNTYMPYSTLLWSACSNPGPINLYILYPYKKQPTPHLPKQRE
ncbi:hypothetical protein, partial [Paenibacillus odorifer]|uniref:hypothetical protein n=1 Tax=Paenibacillus odorifer TaxID=189426 RepID=UPI001C3C7D4F